MVAQRKSITNPAFELEKAIICEEVQAGLETGVDKLENKALSNQERPDHFHNTKLENYARTVMRSKQMMEIINHALEYVKEDPDRSESPWV